MSVDAVKGVSMVTVDVFHYPVRSEWHSDLHLPVKYRFRCLYDTTRGVARHGGTRHPRRLRLHSATTDSALHLSPIGRRRLCEALRCALARATGLEVMAFTSDLVAGDTSGDTVAPSGEKVRTGASIHV